LSVSITSLIIVYLVYPVREIILLVFIDESGGPGFKKGSSPFFTLAMVIFSNYQAAETASQSIGALREYLRVKPEFEFSRSHANVRDAFFQEVRKHDFQVRGLIVDKSAIDDSHIKSNRETFYNYFLGALLRNAAAFLQNALIRLDGFGNKDLRRKLTAYLKNCLGDWHVSKDQKKVTKVSFVDSRKDNLIQLADMCVGVIARPINNDRKDADRWLKLLGSKVEVRQFAEGRLCTLD